MSIKNVIVISGIGMLCYATGKSVAYIKIAKGLLNTLEDEFPGTTKAFLNGGIKQSVNNIMDIILDKGES